MRQRPASSQIISSRLGSPKTAGFAVSKRIAGVGPSAAVIGKNIERPSTVLRQVVHSIQTKEAACGS